MKQVLRFNKVIKLIIIAGDLCILNTIFIVLYHIIDVLTLGETFANSLPRLLVLLNLVYITCNYSKGIILHCTSGTDCDTCHTQHFFPCSSIHQPYQSCRFRNSFRAFFCLVLFLFSYLLNYLPADFPPNFKVLSSFGRQLP